MADEKVKKEKKKKKKKQQQKQNGSRELAKESQWEKKKEVRGNR